MGVTVNVGHKTAAVPHLVEKVFGIEMRPVDVEGIQRLRLLVGFSFLVQTVVELKHTVHLTPPAVAGVLRHRHRASLLAVHTARRPLRKGTMEMTINKDDGRPAGS